MKKFISVALIMIVATTGFLIASKSYIGNKMHAVEGLFEDTETRQEIKFVKYEKTESEHQIYVSYKNNWKKIVNPGTLRLMFYRIDGGLGATIKLPINGYEYNDYSKGNYEFSMGIDPGETRIFIFRIPKEVLFDKEVVDFNKFVVEGQVQDYMFRRGKNTLYGGLGSWTCRAELQNIGEPIVIDNN